MPKASKSSLKLFKISTSPDTVCRVESEFEEQNLTLTLKVSSNLLNLFKDDTKLHS